MHKTNLWRIPFILIGLACIVLDQAMNVEFMLAAEKAITSLVVAVPVSGLASAVAWLLYAEDVGSSFKLGDFKKSFDHLIFLRDRFHKTGEVWHPFVPPERP